MSYVKLETYELCNGTKLKISWTTSADLAHLTISNELVIQYEEQIAVDSSIIELIFYSVIYPIYSCEGNVEVISNITDEAIHSAFSKLYKADTHFKFPSTTVQQAYPTPAQDTKNNKVGLFYGGGKDSLLTAALFGEILGKDNLTLFRLVWDPKEEQLQKKRTLFNEISSGLAQHGFNTVYAETNFYNITADRAISKRPAQGIYFGLFSPLIKKYNINYLCHGHDATEYFTEQNNKLDFDFAFSRPENMKILAHQMSLLLHYTIRVKHLNFAFTPATTFELLVKRYDKLLPHLYMCERTVGKWCLKCRKCFIYALCALSYKYKKTDFKLAYFFNKSKYIKDLVKDIEQHQGKYSKYYFDKLSYRKHINSTIGIINNIDYDYAQQILTKDKSLIGRQKYPDAWPNFLKITQPFRDKDSMEHDKFWLAAMEYESKIGDNNIDNLDAKILAILQAEDISITKSNCINGLNRTTPVKYNF